MEEAHEVKIWSSICLWFSNYPNIVSVCGAMENVLQRHKLFNVIIYTIEFPSFYNRKNKSWMTNSEHNLLRLLLERTYNSNAMQINKAN